MIENIASSIDWIGRLLILVAVIGFFFKIFVMWKKLDVEISSKDLLINFSLIGISIYFILKYSTRITLVSLLATLSYVYLVYFLITLIGAIVGIWTLKKLDKSIKSTKNK